MLDHHVVTLDVLEHVGADDDSAADRVENLRKSPSCCSRMKRSTRLSPKRCRPCRRIPGFSQRWLWHVSWTSTADDAELTTPPCARNQLRLGPGPARPDDRRRSGQRGRSVVDPVQPVTDQPDPRRAAADGQDPDRLRHRKRSDAHGQPRRRLRPSDGDVQPPDSRLGRVLQRDVPPVRRPHPDRGRYDPVQPVPRQQEHDDLRSGHGAIRPRPGHGQGTLVSLEHHAGGRSHDGVRGNHRPRQLQQRRRDLRCRVRLGRAGNRAVRAAALSVAAPAAQREDLLRGLDADLFDPATRTWSSAGQSTIARLYHSVALLLPDATVWVAGSNPFQGAWEPRMEIYTPAYLFTTNTSGQVVPATRPRITTAPARVGYNAAFTVQTPDAADIASAVLIRPGSATHSFDFDQRLLNLAFTTGPGVLNVTSPLNSNVAPPGDYMLFLVNRKGVPSVAAWVQMSPTPNNQPPNGTTTNPAADVTISAGQSVTFAGTGTDPDGTVTQYSWVFPGGTPNTSTSATPGAVTFSTPGTYVVS